VVYVLNSDNYCYLRSLKSVLLDNVNMTSFAFVYSEPKKRLIEVGAALNSQLSTWLLISGAEDLELVCVRTGNTSNIACQHTD